VSHTPQQDEEGFWWRTIIELHPVPQLPAELLHEAVDRRAGWTARERRRAGRGRRRNLTAILRRARLSKAQRRSRGITRRRELARHAERQRVRAQVVDSLADAAKTHVTHPFGVSTTSRSSLEEISQDQTFDRRLTGARARLSEIATTLQTSTTGTEENQPRTGEELRWAVYNEVKGQRFERTDHEWAPFLRSPARRLEQLVVLLGGTSVFGRDRLPADVRPAAVLSPIDGLRVSVGVSGDGSHAPRYSDAFHGPRMVPATIDGEDARGGDPSCPITSEKWRSLKAGAGCGYRECAPVAVAAWCSGREAVRGVSRNGRLSTLDQ
jgi:hypothetical protein